MKITADSHMDHGLNPAHQAWLLKNFHDRQEFFIATVEMPDHLAPLMSGIHGPIVGDEPLGEEDVIYGFRGTRPYPSRLTKRAPRPTRLMTVIAGPSGDEPCVLYTCYGGPLAPREPGDTSLNDEQRAESVAFWMQHALSVDG